MSSIRDLNLLDGLLLMCEFYQQQHKEDPHDPELKDALACILDCERRQMELEYSG